MSEEAQTQMQSELQDDWQDAAASWAHRPGGYWRQWLWIMYLCTSRLGLGPDTQRMLDTFWIMNEWMNQPTNKQCLSLELFSIFFPWCFLFRLVLSAWRRWREEQEAFPSPLPGRTQVKETSAKAPTPNLSGCHVPLALADSSLTFRCLPSLLLEVAGEKFLHLQEKAIHSPWLSFLRVFSGKTEPFSSAV